MSSIMKMFVLLLVIATSVSSPSRSKRHLLQFAKMVKHTTRWSATNYNGYGCWCGSGGRGTPKDALDRCCQEHDRCWDRYSRRYPRWNPAFKSYHYTRWSSGNIICDSRNNNAERYLCNCDREAAMCFARNRYNSDYRQYHGHC